MPNFSLTIELIDLTPQRLQELIAPYQQESAFSTRLKSIIAEARAKFYGETVEDPIWVARRSEIKQLEEALTKWSTYSVSLQEDSNSNDDQQMVIFDDTTLYQAAANIYNHCQTPLLGYFKGTNIFISQLQDLLEAVKQKTVSCNFSQKILLKIKDEQLKMKDQSLQEKDNQLKLSDKNLQIKENQLKMKDKHLQEKDQIIQMQKDTITGLFNGSIVITLANEKEQQEFQIERLQAENAQQKVKINQLDQELVTTKQALTATKQELAANQQEIESTMAILGRQISEFEKRCHRQQIFIDRVGSIENISEMLANYEKYKADSLTFNKIKQGKNITNQFTHFFKSAEKAKKDVLPSALVCPIRQELMIDPVLASDGYTYERDMIETWFKQSNQSPVTNKKLLDKTLRPNLAIKDLINDYINDAVINAATKKEPRQKIGSSV